MADTRDVLRGALGDFAPQPDGYERVLRRRERKRRNERIGAMAVVAAIVLAGPMLFLRATSDPPDPVDTPVTADTPDRGIFQRTATIGGVSVTSPSDWTLVDHWADFAFLPEAFEERGIPVLEVTNFDPGLSTPVCGERPTSAERLPADGVAILMIMGNDGGGQSLCGGSADAVISGVFDGFPYHIATMFGPEATAEDRVLAEGIADSISPSDITPNWRKGEPRYVLDGWVDDGSAWLLEVHESGGDVVVTRSEATETGTFSEGTEDLTTDDAVEGSMFGLVTEDAARVEYRRAGFEDPYDARLIDLPPSLDVPFDAFVVLPPAPDGGPSETLAYDAEGRILGSNLPPIVRSERVGTVSAFGASWDVIHSTDRSGWYGAVCVEPASDASTPSFCERGWGGGADVQIFETPVPAVFVSTGAGVDAVDVVTEAGRVFHAVKIRGGYVVAALEGAGPGRFVYYYDGKTDQSRPFDWDDVGQVIGEGDFPPPGEEKG